MSNIINLNQFRKRKTRDKKRTQSDENAVKFGRNKAEKELEQARKDKENRDLDGHERE
ncbi:MAG: DUF4169 family protein [Pelagimonas sp.]|uniref:DUF4169 family protein n=1 Tax=Pelagimonas sp. TaxID=2073170 RepID=UPI003D6C395E